MSRTYEEKIAVIVPASDEDFQLLLSIPSIAPHVDEVWIHDDGSRDTTPQVISYLTRRDPNIQYTESSEHRGVLYSIETLLAACNARHVFRIDADDVLYPDAVKILNECVEDAHPFYRLGLLECWGDFHHTRRGLDLIHDPAHIYMDRAAGEFYPYQEQTPGRFLRFASRNGVELRNWSGRLFFHLTGAREDRRLVIRSLVKRWERSGRPCDLHDWDPFVEMTRKGIHQRAMKFLFENTVITAIPDELIPPICKRCDRFQILFDESGHPVNRLDLGWSIPAWEN